MCSDWNWLEKNVLEKDVVCVCVCVTSGDLFDNNIFCLSLPGRD